MTAAASRVARKPGTQGASVLVTSPEARCLRRALRHVGGSFFSWAYLGRDVTEFRRLEGAVAGRGAYVETADMFHAAAEQVRDPYFEYVYRLGKELNSLRWWVSAASHRGSYTSWTYHQACCLKAAIELISSWAGALPLVVVVADEPVRLALSLNLAQFSGVKILGVRRPTFMTPIMDALRMAVHRIAYLLREGRRLLVAGFMTRAEVPPGGPMALLISPVDAAAVGEQRPFSEAYFGDLADQLARRGHKVGLVPFVSRGMSYGAALSRLRAEAHPVLVPHRWLKVRDLFWAVAQTLPPLPTPRALPTLEGMDISPLIREERRLDWISNWSAESLLMAALVRRWAARDFQIRRLIYLYENNPWERALCWATRQLLPGTDLVAFQHSRLPRFLLKFFLAPGEEAIQPQPHRIVTPGAYGARLLCDNGHSQARIRVGGGLRSQRFLSMSASGVGAADDSREPLVLVALQMGWEDTAELLDQVGEAFVNDTIVRVVVKPHPLLPLHEIEDRLGKPLPVHLRVSHEPLSDLLRQASVLVYGGSTACIEALIFEVPLVHVRPWFISDTDPLEHARDARLEATGVDELRENVRWLLEHREEYVARQRERWQALVRDMFGPVTEATYRAFVE